MTEPENAVSARADLGAGLFTIGFGLLVAIASWRMDRLEHLHINRYEIPGLVPGLLGCAITLLGGALALRAVARGALAANAQQAPATAGSAKLLVQVMVAMLGYSLLLVGHGLPFWLVTFGFVAAFIYHFDRQRQTGLGRSRLRRASLALVCGAATSAVVTLVFQHLFYVRLP